MADTRRRWRRRRALLGLLVVVALCAIIGCQSTVTPPADVTDPVVVHLLKDQLHLGLILDREDGTFVEYGFGDWDWYALGHDSWYHAFDTVLWPTAGTLVRKTIRTSGADALRRRYAHAELSPLTVEREKQRALLAKLDAECSAHSDTRHYNPVFGIECVRSDDSFWCLFNCNDSMTRWLEELGCHVSWVPVRLGIAVAR